MGEVQRRDQELSNPSLWQVPGLSRRILRYEEPLTAFPYRRSRCLGERLVMGHWTVNPRRGRETGSPSSQSLVHVCTALACGSALGRISELIRSVPGSRKGW
jgi:hypothetical protein